MLVRTRSVTPYCCARPPILRERFGDAVLTAMVRENERVAEAPSHALPVTMYDAHSSGAEDYRAVAREVLARVPQEVAA